MAEEAKRNKKRGLFGLFLKVRHGLMGIPPTMRKKRDKEKESEYGGKYEIGSA